MTAVFLKQAEDIDGLVQRPNVRSLYPAKGFSPWAHTRRRLLDALLYEALQPAGTALAAAE